MTTNPRHLSLSVEHYTPPEVVEAARLTLGAIDLDPATSALGAAHVKPAAFFTEADDGFVQEWWGRVFLNPPGGRSDIKQQRVLPKCRETGACGLPIGHEHIAVESSQKKWWFKLAREWVDGRVGAALFVGFSLEILQVTQQGDNDGLPIPLDFPCCYPRSRLAYWKEVDGKLVESTSPPHASVLVLLPPLKRLTQERLGMIRLFDDNFSSLGKVIAP